MMAKVFPLIIISHNCFFICIAQVKLYIYLSDIIIIILNYVIKTGENYFQISLNEI